MSIHRNDSSVVWSENLTKPSSSWAVLLSVIQSRIMQVRKRAQMLGTGKLDYKSHDLPQNMIRTSDSSYPAQFHVYPPRYRSFQLNYLITYRFSSLSKYNRRQNGQAHRHHNRDHERYAIPCCRRCLQIGVYLLWL